MNEKNLSTIATIVFALGILILFSLQFFISPIELTTEIIPKDIEVSYKGTIENVRTSDDGSVLTVKRIVQETIYVDSIINESYLGKEIEVVGMQQGEFFEVKEITVVN